MKTKKLFIATFTLMLLGIFQTGRAQQFEIDPVYYTIFDQDSLSGFNETEARALAIYEGSLGSEFKIKMYRLKREYINQKYGLISTRKKYLDNFFSSPLPAQSPVVPGCVNE